MNKDPIVLDRTVSFGLLLAIVIQTAGALFWAGAADARLETLERSMAQTPQINQRLARLEEQFHITRDLLMRIEKRLDEAAGGPR